MPDPTTNPNVTLYQALRRIITQYPARPALTCGAQHLTYKEFGEQIESWARRLRSLGVGPGDKIAIIIPNSLDYACAFFAPAVLGAVIVPLNPVYRDKEFRHILGDAEASVVIAAPPPAGSNLFGILTELRPALPCLGHMVTTGPATPGFVGLAEVAEDARPLPPDPISPEELCALVYTSGTTGLPKAVMQSHRSMVAAVFQGSSQLNRGAVVRMWDAARLVRRYGTRYLKWGTKQITLMAPAPMHALLGYSAMIYGLLYGFRVVMAERFNPPRVLELIEQEHVNAMIASPTMVQAILNSPEFARRDLTSLLSVLISSAPCPPELALRARNAFGCTVAIAFGTTEVGGATLITNGFDHDREQTETVGRLLQGMEARVVDDQRHPLPAGQTGELALRLGSTMLGYYKAPELTAQALDSDGWYYTGDLATIDNKGYVRIVGRLKDLIIRGGQNIYPAEIEYHLLSKPGIENVAVVGVPDTLAGERVWAFVVPKPGASLTPQQVLNYCRGEMAAYKVPDQARIVENLPTTSTGKVQKFELRERALKELQQPQPGQAQGVPAV